MKPCKLLLGTRSTRAGGRWLREAVGALAGRETLTRFATMPGRSEKRRFFDLARRAARVLIGVGLFGVGINLQADGGRHVLRAASFAAHAAKFNATEPEEVVNAVPDAEAWDWLRDNVPFFECSDASTEEIYWFRWWSLRKHLKRDDASGRWVFTEFITKPRPISSALGHHLMEGRWLREQHTIDDYVLYWLRSDASAANRSRPPQRADSTDRTPTSLAPRPDLHKYSQWLDDALWQRWLVTHDTASLTSLLDDLVADYRMWEAERGRPDGLFWQYDVRDAMEESISGGRKVKNVRPTINSYMFGNARAIARIARLAGRATLAEEFEAKAAHLRRLVQQTLWNESLEFFGSVNERLEPISVREEIGFIPWYFELPESGHGYERAWLQLKDERGFKAPFGITTAERRHLQFRTHGTGTCEWDGAVWPFATAQTLTALANVIRDYPGAPVSAEDYFEAFETYVRSQRYDGRPYIGEYLDERTGAWLMGPNPRSRYYNHSTFADLVIAGIVGLVPRPDDVVEVSPLLPPNRWSWFCLDGIRYHGHDLTIVWDQQGTRYGRGAGFFVLVDGKEVARADGLKKISGRLP